ncbi:MAG: glycosyltransferase family 39 protein [Anaerolineae bacterium]|nr:glycosyltransferase family 39 protein [Anaerolineae bacterium]
MPSERAEPPRSQKPVMHLAGRYGIWTSLLLACVLGTVYILALDWTVQGYDDAGYILIARSLASGSGYRIAPGEAPWAVTTPLLPFLLTPIWFLHPQLPHDVVWFKIVPLVCALLSVPVLVLYFVRARQAPWAAALGIVTLAFLSPPTFTYAARMVMTELPYLLFSAIALLLAHRALLKGARSLWMWAALGLALAAACLTRTVGMALVAGVLVYLLWHRRWRACLGLALLVTALLLPWQLYAHSQGDLMMAPGQYQSDFLLREYGNPGLGQIGSYWEVVPRVLRNVTGHVDESIPGLFLPGLTGDRVLFLLRRVGLGWFRPAFGVGAVLGMALGWAVSWRRSATPLEWYVLLYMGMILLPPWRHARNLVPVLPFLLYYLWMGLQAGHRWLIGQLPSLSRWTRAAGVALFAVMLVSVAASDRHQIQQGINNRAGQFPVWEQSYYEAGDWLRENVPASASIAAPIPRKMMLYIDQPVQYLPLVGDGEAEDEDILADFLVVQPKRPTVEYEWPEDQIAIGFVRDHPERCQPKFASQQFPYTEIFACSLP